ncbi:MAG: sulfite exporter TauE/SafE family protein [Gammaproteobacteria bacterium]
MESSNIIFILLLAFPIGMVHALDADHVVAVTGLVNRKSGITNSVVFCLNWAIGHSFTLLAIGAAIFLFSLSIPASMASYAEFTVGALLIVIGIGVARDIAKKDLHLHFHQHDNKPEHAHWHSHKDCSRKEHSHQHRAVMIGVLHGAAGYAPLIAVIPLTATDSPWFALLYLLIFGAGVFVSMLFVGGLLGIIFKQLSHKSDRIMNIFRGVIGIVSVALGSVLMFNVVTA